MWWMLAIWTTTTRLVRTAPLGSAVVFRSSSVAALTVTNA